MQSNPSAAISQSDQRNPHLPYLPGLDGLRALAVIAVVLYHAGLKVRGGYLGVESFFVISGYLITALLLVEWQHNGRVNLTAFWLRRARRLLPALFLLLGGTLVFASLMLPNELAELRSDTLAALGYVMNWHLIWAEQSYFDPLVRPPLLQHLWSLAVEEQFYLLWPLLFAVGMRLLRARGLFIATLLAAIASTLVMALLFQPGSDPSRIYYGTDTRAAGLLLGAALALVWPSARVAASPSHQVGIVLDLVGTLALGTLLACFLWLYEQHPLLYRGGFTLIALSTVVVIMAITYSDTHWLPRLLSWGVLRWIGLRSYSIYLWHWPVFLVTRPYADLPFNGGPLLVVRLAIVAALAELSYRYVELPM